jgi:hypothetical protein
VREDIETMTSGKRVESGSVSASDHLQYLEAVNDRWPVGDVDPKREVLLSGVSEGVRHIGGTRCSLSHSQRSRRNFDHLVVY